LRSHVLFQIELKVLKHQIKLLLTVNYFFEPNKQKMYESVERVYHSSISEVACLIKDECYQTGTLFFGNSATTPEVSTLSNTEILGLWKNTLQI
jgi:hypothetical protein